MNSPSKDYNKHYICNTPHCLNSDRLLNYVESKFTEIMRSKKVCFQCAYWLDKIKNPMTNRLIIDGSHYTPDLVAISDTGLRNNIDIGYEYFRTFETPGKPMVFGVVKRFLHQGDIPIEFRKRLPNNATKITKGEYLLRHKFTSNNI